MIRPIDIRLNAAHPDLPLAEAVTYTGAPSTVLIRGVPGNCGRWAITAVFVAATFPDGSTSTRTAVQSANGVWVATLPATATSGRTAHGLRILADGADENGEAVGGYVLGVADFAVASLAVTPAPEPGVTSWQMLYFDAVPSVLRKGDVTRVDGVLKLYNGTAWEAFATPPALDDAVTRTSANGVKSSGIWSAIWGALSALPAGFSSLYDWVVNQLAGKVSDTRTVNGKPLSSNVTLTGADIPVDATQGARKISVALAGKLDKSGGEMTGSLSSPQVNITRIGYPTWSMELDDVVGGFHFRAPSDGFVLGSVDLSLPRRTENLSGILALTAGTGHDGNLAALDASGNPTDSGVKASDKLDSTSAAPAFSTSSTYAVGDHVTYNGALYRCTTAVTTAGAWDASKWTADMASNYFQYALTTKTIDNGAVTLDDRSMNAVAVSSALASLTINFPTATSGKVRDFGLRLSVASGITTAPELVLPQGITFENADGEVPEIGADGAATILYFTETAAGVFLVKGEVVTAIS